MFPDIPDYPIINKTSQKKLPKAITFLKKEGGGSGKVLSWSQIQCFFLKPSLIIFLLIPVKLNLFNTTFKVVAYISNFLQQVFIYFNLRSFVSFAEFFYFTV